jgi:hypothetical protein
MQNEKVDEADPPTNDYEPKHCGTRPKPGPNPPETQRRPITRMFCKTAHLRRVKSNINSLPHQHIQIK